MVLTDTPNPGPSDPTNNPNVPGLNPTQAKNAQLIVSVGKALGVNQNGIVTALAVAGTESSWKNYASINVPGSKDFPHDDVGHDHDSIGLFQQRAGDYGWMPRGDLKTGMDPLHQAAAFYGGTPNATAPGLMQQRGWENSDPAIISQQVQGSAVPGAYAGFVRQAKGIFSALQAVPPAQLPFTPRTMGNQKWEGGEAPPAPPAAPPAGRAMAAPPTQQQRQATSALNRANPEPAPVQMAPAPAPRPGIATAAGPAAAPSPGLPLRGPMKAI